MKPITFEKGAVQGRLVKPAGSLPAFVKPAQSLPLGAADSFRFSGQQVKKQSLMSRLVQNKLPIALLSAASIFAPLTSQQAKAAITPESGKLVQTLESKDEELIETALINLSAVNERDAIPHITKILSEAKSNEDTLNAAIKALGKIGAHASDAEKAEFSSLLRPYLLKVIGVDKDKNVSYLHPGTAKSFLSGDSRNEVRDGRLAAARALGKIADAATINQFTKVARDASQSATMRQLALEALRHSPTNPNVDGELLKMMDELNPEQDATLLNQVVNVLLAHNAKEVWAKIDKIMGTGSSGKSSGKEINVDGTPFKIIIAGPNITEEALPIKGLQQAGPTPATRSSSELSPAQQSVIGALLESKHPDAAPIIVKQVAQNPEFFLRGPADNVLLYFQAQSPTVREKVLDLLDAGNKASSPDKAAEAQMKNREAKRLGLIFAALLNVKKAAPTFRQMIADPLESPDFRYIATVASGMLKDKEAIPTLMNVVVDDSEDVEMRYDALYSVMEIQTPPLAKDLQSNRQREKALLKYVRVYSGNPKFTQSFYKAEMFEEIREARKALLKANAPLTAIDEVTIKAVDKHYQNKGTSEQWKALASHPDVKKYADKLADYVGKRQNADGFLRLLMIKALGEVGAKDIKPALEDLVHNPLARTQIEDIVSSNDMFMFPGYTKQQIADTTRLMAIQALGKIGDVDSAKLIEKGLRSDNRRLHMFSISALSDIGKNTKASTDAKVVGERKAISDRLLVRLPNVSLEGSDRLDNYFKKIYAQAIDNLGGSNDLLNLMDTTNDTVLKRAIANGMIYNDSNLDNPKVAQYLLVNSLGLADLHKKGIDGRGTEVAIIDGDYMNDDIEGLEGKVIYPSWGNTKDATLRESFHDESVASVMVGKRANVTYGIAPGVEKIYSYAAWDDDLNATETTPLEEKDGMLRALDDIITKKIKGESKVSVVNMSLGGTSALLYGDETTVKFYLDKMAARFEAGSKAGITFVISAGNERGEDFRHHLVGTLNALGFGKENGKLVQSKGVLLVGATDTRGASNDRSKHRMSWFSSMGDPFNASKPNIVAPGTNIPLVNREVDGAINIDEADGTSFSAPITAGVALLMNQASGKPLETEQLQSILANTAFQLADTPEFMQGPGALDARKAIEAAQRLGLEADVNKLKDKLNQFIGDNPPEVKVETPKAETAK